MTSACVIRSTRSQAWQRAGGRELPVEREEHGPRRARDYGLVRDPDGAETFGIFDAFADERGRDAHLQGKLAKQITSKAPELFARPPEMQRV